MVLAAGGYKLRKAGLFACSADGYGDERYVAYCQAAGYGDYDYGAFWYGLEPVAIQAARSADVLFVGNSRMQFGASTQATKQWFRSQNLSHYLLGFAFNGNVTFAGPLLHRLQPRARMYVVSVDQFFRQVKPLPAAVVMTDTARTRYRVKQVSQLVHRALCGRARRLCGKEFSYVRTRSDGSWILTGGHDWKATPVAYADTVNKKLLEEYVRAGRSFISQLPVGHDCILLTLIPSAAGSSVTESGTARALAAALGLTFVAPEPTNLMTFDGSHLDQRSAEEWSSAFILAAGPVIQRCLTSP